MKSICLALAAGLCLLFSALAFADGTCICGVNHKFTAPNKLTAFNYCAKVTPRGQKVNVHSCAQARKPGFGEGDNDCSPQISCDSCTGYHGEYSQQTCHVVNCDGTINSFTQTCTAP